MESCFAVWQCYHEDHRPGPLLRHRATARGMVSWENWKRLHTLRFGFLFLKQYVHCFLHSDILIILFPTNKIQNIWDFKISLRSLMTFFLLMSGAYIVPVDTHLSWILKDRRLVILVNQ